MTAGATRGEEGSRGCVHYGGTCDGGHMTAAGRHGHDSHGADGGRDDDGNDGDERGDVDATMRRV